MSSGVNQKISSGNSHSPQTPRPKVSESIDQTNFVNNSSNLLAVVLDINSVGWSEADQFRNKISKTGISDEKLGESFKSYLQQILVFLNAYLVCSHNNSLAVIAASPTHSDFIYTTDDDKAETNDDKSSSKELEKSKKSKLEAIYQLQALDIRLRIGLSEFLTNVDKPIKTSNSLQEPLATGLLETSSSTSKNISESSSITSAVSKALCYIQRIKRQNKSKEIFPRIVIISVSPDSADHYISMMNCISAAQRISLPIDTVKLAGGDTFLLEQGAHLTKGRYIDLRPKLEANKSKDEANFNSTVPGTLLQYLLFAVLPEQQLRDQMIPPSQSAVDFRAACFCHQKVIDVGYVCSVCLSIFCEFRESCKTCRSKFSIGEGTQEIDQNNP